MFWKIHPLLSKYFNIELLDISNSSSNLSISNKNAGLTVLNENERAIDFLFENPQYITCNIFSNKGFIPFIKKALIHNQTIYGGAFPNSYLNNKFVNHKKTFHNYLDWCKNCIMSNDGLTVDEAKRIINFMDIEPRLTYDFLRKHDYYDRRLSGEWYEDYWCLCVNPNIKENIIRKIENMDTIDELYKCKKFINETWILSKPDYYSISVSLYNKMCEVYDEYDIGYSDMENKKYKYTTNYKNKYDILDINVHPCELHEDILKCLFILLRCPKRINEEYVIHYIATYFDELLYLGHDYIVLGITEVAFFSININVLKYPRLIEKYENNNQWLNALCQNPYFFEYFISRLGNGIIEKINKYHWNLLYTQNERFLDILKVSSEYYNCKLEEVDDYIPNLKYALLNFSLLSLGNPAWFVEDIEKIVEYKKVYFKELMEKMWSPKRIHKLLDAGIDPDDF